MAFSSSTADYLLGGYLGVSNLILDVLCGILCWMILASWFACPSKTMVNCRGQVREKHLSLVFTSAGHHRATKSTASVLRRLPLDLIHVYHFVDLEQYNLSVPFAAFVMLRTSLRFSRFWGAKLNYRGSSHDFGLVSLDGCNHVGQCNSDAVR